MALDSTIWGPHMWFFLHTSAMCYPLRPNSVTKKKFYDFFQNLHLFIPVESMGSYFSKLLDEYPISPYLDNRESLIRWVWFIHNKINEKLEKPQISLNDFYVKYYEAYKSKNVKLREYYKIREKIIYISLLLIVVGLIYYLYDK
jgi:hypothetical protein